MRKGLSALFVLASALSINYSGGTIVLSSDAYAQGEETEVLYSVSSVFFCSIRTSFTLADPSAVYSAQDSSFSIHSWTWIPSMESRHKD